MTDPDRLPPQNVEAEVQCLGACLLDPAAAETVLPALREEDLYKHAHALILAGIRSVAARGERPDLVTLGAELDRRKHLEEAGGASYLALIVDATPTAALVKQHLRLVKEASIRRRCIAAGTRFLSEMFTGELHPAEAVAHLSEDLDAYVDVDPSGARGLVPVKLADALNAWRHENPDGRQPARIKTPIPKLNACLGGGFEPGDLVYLGARPGVGKTALALEIARRSAEDGAGVLVISREMAIVRLVRRILAQASRIPASTIKSGMFTDAEYPRLTNTYGALSTLPLWLCDQAISLADITRLVERWAFTPPLGLVIVDYLQLVRAPKEVRDRRLQVEAVSQGLKSLAMTCHLPVLCLSSLSRPEKGAPDRKPTLADLRESGELEHDADIVIFLHRGFQQEETTLIVAKNRDGRVGETELRFRSEFVAFEQPEDQP
jgi:replicative DNA helicase